MPLQSIHQLMDTLALAMVFTFLIGLLDNSIDSSSFIFIFLISWFFGCMSCRMSLPANLIITSHYLASDTRIIEDYILSDGYDADRQNDVKFYSPKIFKRMPWRNFSRFLMWKENTIQLIARDNTIVVSGPVFFIEKIANNLALHG